MQRTMSCIPARHGGTPCYLLNDQEKEVWSALWCVAFTEKILHTENIRAKPLNNAVLQRLRSWGPRYEFDTLGDVDHEG